MIAECSPETIAPFINLKNIKCHAPNCKNFFWQAHKKEKNYCSNKCAWRAYSAAKRERRVNHGSFKRDGNYWIDYYDAEGRRHRKRIGPQKTVAQLALKDVKVKIAKGEYLGIYEEKKTLFKDFSEKYLKMVQPNLSPTSYARFEGIISNHLKPTFQCYLYKISKKQIQEYIQKRSEEVEPATVNQEIKRLRHMLNKAIEWGYLKENPCKGIKNLKEPPGRIRYIASEELESLLKPVNPLPFWKTLTTREGPFQNCSVLS